MEVQLNDMTGFAARRRTEMPLAELKPHKNNPRTHSKKQIGQIADSIRRFGFTNPVLVDDDHNIIAGHGRVDAARTLGLTHVPTIALPDMPALNNSRTSLSGTRTMVAWALFIGRSMNSCSIPLQDRGGPSSRRNRPAGVAIPSKSNRIMSMSRSADGRR
jgi:ParB-like nuclease domain